MLKDLIRTGAVNARIIVSNTVWCAIVNAKGLELTPIRNANLFRQDAVGGVLDQIDACQSLHIARDHLAHAEPSERQRNCEIAAGTDLKNGLRGSTDMPRVILDNPASNARQSV